MFLFVVIILFPLSMTDTPKDVKKHLMSQFIFSHLPGSSQSSAGLFPPLRLLQEDNEVFTSQSRGAISPACPRSTLWSCPSWTCLKYLIWEACWSPNSVWSWVDGLANVWFKGLLWWWETGVRKPQLNRGYRAARPGGRAHSRGTWWPTVIHGVQTSHVCLSNLSCLNWLYLL